MQWAWASSVETYSATSAPCPSTTRELGACHRALRRVHAGHRHWHRHRQKCTASPYLDAAGHGGGRCGRLGGRWCLWSCLCRRLRGRTGWGLRGRGGGAAVGCWAGACVPVPALMMICCPIDQDRLRIQAVQGVDLLERHIVLQRQSKQRIARHHGVHYSTARLRLNGSLRLRLSLSRSLRLRLSRWLRGG